MRTFSAKNLVFALMLAVGSLFTLPTHAWPDVDHMNMCGAAAKTVRTYNGEFQGWKAHDSYIAKRGMAYYFRSMCPETKAVKMKKKKAYKKAMPKKPLMKKPEEKKPAMEKPDTKEADMKKDSETKVKIKAVKRIAKSSYNKKLDCERVDRLNTLGLAVRMKGKY